MDVMKDQEKSEEGAATMDLERQRLTPFLPLLPGAATRVRMMWIWSCAVTGWVLAYQPQRLSPKLLPWSKFGWHFKARRVRITE